MFSSIANDKIVLSDPKMAPNRYYHFGRLVVFYGISTLVDHLMSNHVLHIY